VPHVKKCVRASATIQELEKQRPEAATTEASKGIRAYRRFDRICARDPEICRKAASARRLCRSRFCSCYWLDEVVVESVEVVVGATVSVGAGVVVDVEEVSGSAEVEAPSTAGVEVELTNGGALTILVPFD
jgi:hypothetical protein